MSLTSLTDQRIRLAQSMADRAVNPEQIRALMSRLAEQVRTGVLPPYGGIPIIQTLTQKLSRMQNAQGTAQAQQNAQRPPIAQEVMQQAQAEEGVAALPSGLPAQMAGGGIVAFEDGGKVERYQNQGLVRSPYSNLSFEQLRPYEPTSYGTVDRTLLNMFRTPGAVRIDPVTNEPITFAEFQRRRESSLAQEASPVAQAMVPTALAAAPTAAAAVAPPATPAATPPASSQADRLRGDAIDSRAIGIAPAIPFFTPTEFSLPQQGAPSVKLPTINLPQAPAPTDFKGIVRGLPDRAAEAFEDARDAEERALRAMTEPGEKAREAKFAAREASLAKDSAISRALNIMSAGFGVAGSKEKTLAGALGNEGVKGIQALIQGEAANRVAKERLEDARDNFEQQKIAARKGDRAAANAAGQRAADDLRAYTGLNFQAAQAGSAEAMQRYQAQQSGVLGKAGLEQAGALGVAGLQQQAAAMAQQGALGLAGLQMQGANLNQQTAYLNAVLAQKDRQLSILDSATRAKYAQQKNLALKQFDAAEGARLSRQLSQQYGPKWGIGQDPQSLAAQQIYESARVRYLLNALNEFEVAGDRRGGARSAESLLGGSE